MHVRLFLPLQILTKDSVTVSVDGVVYFRIQCPISSVANVSNAHSSTRLLAQTTLRNALGTKNLAELLSDREGISISMQVRPRFLFFLFFIQINRSGTGLNASRLLWLLKVLY